MNRSLSLIEAIIISCLAVLLGVALVSVLTGMHFVVATVCIIAAVALLLLLVRLNLSPDRLRARQSERTLKLAAQTLPYMQKGLNKESAKEVCKLLLPATGASAVSLTDREKILGYFGRGMSSHPAGTPIRSSATKRSIEEGKVQVARSHQEIGTSDRKEALQAAITVPLKQRDEVVGVLKFYYKSSRQIDANQQAMAEGLAGLLEMQLRLAELEYQRELAVKMSLKALQAQINPHFLFNTINTIAALIRTDPHQARILLREFATFYRQTLDNTMGDLTLDGEITQTLRYLGFERARFGRDRIIFDGEIDEALKSLKVPAFIIQPLVENAVAHAMKEDEPLHISIEGFIQKGHAIIMVKDDGVGMSQTIQERALKENEEHAGVALKNVAKRLEGFFGTNAGLEVESELGKGTQITLNLGRMNSLEEGTND